MNDIPTAWASYEWRGGRERMVTIGGDGPTILFLAPLFEEANRTRHFLIETMRGVAARGYRCILPDLPGTLESLTPLTALAWDDWTGAAKAAFEASGARHIVSVRGGALLDGDLTAASRYRLSPADGAALMRDLVRIRMAADREDGATKTTAEIETLAAAELFDVAGYSLAPDFTSGMKSAQLDAHQPVRVARLATDAQPADIKLTGQPLWRRTEPGHDPALSESLANDISDWIASCAAG